MTTSTLKYAETWGYYAPLINSGFVLIEIFLTVRHVSNYSQKWWFSLKNSFSSGKIYLDNFIEQKDPICEVCKRRAVSALQGTFGSVDNDRPPNEGCREMASQEVIRINVFVIKPKWTFDDMLSIRKPNVAEIFGNDSASSRLIIEVWDLTLGNERDLLTHHTFDQNKNKQVQSCTHKTVPKCANVCQWCWSVPDCQCANLPKMWKCQIDKLIAKTWLQNQNRHMKKNFISASSINSIKFTKTFKLTNFN